MTVHGAWACRDAAFTALWAQWIRLLVPTALTLCNFLFFKHLNCEVKTSSLRSQHNINLYSLRPISSRTTFVAIGHRIYFPSGFLPISLSTSLTMLRSTNWFRSGSGFPAASPVPAWFAIQKVFDQLPGVSGLYLNHKNRVCLDGILVSLMVPPKRGMLTY